MDKCQFQILSPNCLERLSNLESLEVIIIFLMRIIKNQVSLWVCLGFLLALSDSQKRR